MATIKPQDAKFDVRKKRIEKLLNKLKELYPNETYTILKYSNDWELLVAVILSAQCTDVMVNKVTEKLFKKYPTLDDYVNADTEKFKQDIKSTGFYNNKAKNVLAAARVVKENFDDKVPQTMEDMLTIPGVARKTANVVLGNAHGIVEGIAVDTHVKRFALRFDLTDHQDPVKIERDLMELLPKDEWFLFTYRVIAYGRTIGPAKGYDPSQDPLTKIYQPKC